jgi:hypothetical protein
VQLSLAAPTGSGTVSYNVVSAGDTGCLVSGSGLVTASAAGTCTINVTITADSVYAAATSNTSTITFSSTSATPSWTLSTIDSGDGGLTGVSCGSSTFCMAVDHFGYALNYNGSSWSSPSLIDSGYVLTGVSCVVGSTFCVAVDDFGHALMYDGSSWTRSSIDGTTQLTGVSCVSSTFCMAVDIEGYAWIYTGGSSWTSLLADPGNNGLSAVSCVSSNFCLAVDWNGYAWIYDGTTWTETLNDFSNHGLTGVSCVSSTFCMAVDNNQYAWIYNGSWSPSLDDAAGEGLTAVSCVSGPFCMVVDNLGNALSYDPSKGGWATSLEDSSVSLNAVSCVSSTFCMAVSNNDNGNAAMYNEPATATVTLTGNTTPTVGVAATYTATVTGAGATPSGTVTFYNAGTAVGGSCTTDTLVSGVATCSITFTSAGSVSITASYVGDANYAAVTQDNSVADAVTVGLGSASVVVTGSAATVGAPDTFTATVSGAAGTPTGNVNFYEGATEIVACENVTLVSGAASCAYTFTTNATTPIAITASYTGETNVYATVANSSSTSYSAVIGLGSASVVVTGNTTPAVGVAATYTATVTGAGATPSGTVTFYNAVTAVGGSCTTDTLVSGVATCSITFTSAGSVSITASYGGQTNVYATVAQGSSVADAVTVGKGTATVTLTGNTTPTVGVAATYTATVTGAGATPSGTVTFYNAGTAVGGSCTTDTLVSGVATCSITFTSAGSVSITASYVGDANYAAVTQDNSVAIPVRVAPPTGPTNAPPPTNPRVPASSFGTPTSVTASCAAATTVSETSGGASETITVPECALPSGTTVSAYPVINTAPLVAQVPAGSSYVLSFAVTWEAPNGTSPTATAPITMTITDPSIVAGDTIYELTSTGLVAVGTATANGTVTITFSSDPIFLVSHTTPVAQASLRITTLSGTLGTALTLVTSGGSGSGAVSFTVTNATATGCRITGRSLTATGAGKCLVTAKKAADTTYLAASSSATTVRFTAKVIPVHLHATRVHHYARVGRTVTMTIVGTGFYGKPTITSNEAGTRAVVTHDSGKLLTVRVTVRAGSPKGKHTFTIRLANGKSCRIYYLVK